MPSREEMEPYLTKPAEPPRFHNHIEDGGRVIASFESQEDAELFRWAKSATADVSRRAAAYEKTRQMGMTPSVAAARLTFDAVLADYQNWQKQMAERGWVRPPAHEVGHGLPGAEFGDEPAKSLPPVAVEELKRRRESVLASLEADLKVFGWPVAEPPDEPGKTVADLVDVVRQQREVAQGNRCGFCGAVSPEFPECCPQMKAEFARLEVAFWGPPKMDAISAWLVPKSDEPAVVPSKEPS